MIVWIVLLTQSVAATMVAGVFSPSASLVREPHRPSFRSILAIITWGSVVCSGWQLWQANPPLAIALPAMLQAASSMSGIALKWLLTLIAPRDREFDERGLVCALMLSPLAVAGAGWMVPDRAVSESTLLWFANGVFWQALAGDLPAFLRKHGGRRPST